jgi:excinuclease UvrABC nuclease subunit
MRKGEIMKIDLPDKLIRYQGDLKEYFDILTKLISSKPIPLKSNLDDKIPRESGFYRIFEKTQRSIREVYVGSSKNIKRRITKDLLGKGKHTLKKKVTSNFLKNNCLIQFLPIKDERELKLLEDFTTAILRPKYNY